MKTTFNLVKAGYVHHLWFHKNNLQIKAICFQFPQYVIETIDFMVGFFSSSSLSPNSLELACRKRFEAGLPLLDLTDTNPTNQGYDFPAEVLRRGAQRYFRQAKRRYQPNPKGLLAARQTIAAYYAQRPKRLALSPDAVFLTAGTSESYSLLFSLLCEPGDNVLAPKVTYPLFDLLAAHHRLELKTYNLLEERGWSIDEEQLVQVVDSKTRAILVISPHNPTGKIHSRPLETIARLGLPIICDEVFAEFTQGEARCPPLGSLYPDSAVFHLNGISKMFALPDLKLAWIALNPPALKVYGQRLELLNDTFLSANSLVQSILPEIFEEGRNFLSEMRVRIAKSMNLAVAILRSCKHIQVTSPEGAYFLFPRLLMQLDEEELAINLIQRGVLVHPGYFYGADNGSHFMISCLVQEEKLSKGLETVVSLLKSI